MTPGTVIPDLLRAPLDPDWTVEGMAEKLLAAVAERPSADEFVVVIDDATDRQSRRLIRPLLACLATKSADETGTPVNLYGGRLAFRRPSPTGPMWVVGEFENGLASVRLAIRRSDSPDADGLTPRTRSAPSVPPASPASPGTSPASRS